MMNQVSVSAPPAVALIEASNEQSSTLGERLIAAAHQHGFGLAHGLNLDRQQFADLVRSMGTCADHRFGTGSAELLELNADRDPTKIVTGRSALPLHTDGALVGTYPSFIVLYCAEVQHSQPGSGNTEICNQAQALEKLPRHLAELFTIDWEYLVHDTSHFPDIAGRWLPIPATVTNRDGRRQLNVALPFDRSATHRGWEVRLPGLSIPATTMLMEELNDHLRSATCFYTHRWSAGDLLVIDNTRCLHGRSAITGDDKRHLFRGQLR